MFDQYPFGPDVGKSEQTAGISAGRWEENLWLIARGGVTHCSSFCFGAAPIWQAPCARMTSGLDGTQSSRGQVQEVL
jgi:hypothetical protein